MNNKNKKNDLYCQPLIEMCNFSFDGHKNVSPKCNYCYSYIMQSDACKCTVLVNSIWEVVNLTDIRCRSQLRSILAYGWQGSHTEF